MGGIPPTSVSFHAWGTFTATPDAWEATRAFRKPGLCKLLREPPAVARIGLNSISFLFYHFSAWQLAIMVADIYRDDELLYDCPFAWITIEELFREEALNPKPKPPKPKYDPPPKPPRKVSTYRPSLRPAKHGTTVMYHRGCRCEWCCNAMVIARAKYRKIHFIHHPRVKKIKPPPKNPGGWKFDTD